VSAPRRPGDDRRAGRRAEPRDRRGAPTRKSRSTGETPRDDKPADGEKPARTGKPRTNRSEAWATARPRERDAAKPATGRKPRERRPDRDEPHSPTHNAAPWDATPADKRPDNRRRADKPTARHPRREENAAQAPRNRRPDRAEAPAPRVQRPSSDKGKPTRADASTSRPPRQAADKNQATRPAPRHGADRGEPLFTRRPRGDAETPAPRAKRPTDSRDKGTRGPARAEASESRERPRSASRRTPAAPAAPAPRTHSRREPQRIAKLLARAGVASRREIERMIAEGRIALDGKVLDTPATIITSLQGVTVDGHQVDAPEDTRLFLFHKPVGFLTTEHDPAGRPTIYDRLPDGLPRVMPVGRLDMNTEGLLLLTTDGEFKRKLELPSTGVPRIYRARAYGEIHQEQLETLSEGITIDGIRYGPIDANMERRTGRNVWIEIKITEGKNREVRRVLEHLELQVSRLIRVAYGEFILADLPAGEVVEVRQHDLEEFRKTLR
jgi:23S rRNA pseudouridine2605 synthase